MKPPSATWETDYKHDRREHRHRCWCCSKIVNEGERVLMNRVTGKRTRAMHISHADQAVFPGQPMTWRQLAEEHGNGYLRSIGWTR